MDPYSTSGDVIWIVVVGFIIAFILAFAVGANDVANSFGTSVGSKVLTLKQACILAVIFETLELRWEYPMVKYAGVIRFRRFEPGAVLIGYKVSDTIWKSIVSLDIYEKEPKTLMLGELAALISAAVWLMIATVMKIPVSGTHSIVGATMGFSLVKKGGTGIQWEKLGYIVASWFVSPICAGIVSSFLFVLIRRFILTRQDHLEPALRAMPVFYGITILINSLSIFIDGAPSLYLDRIPWWGAVILCVGLGLITAILVHIFMVPWQRKRILKKMQEPQLDTASPTPSPSLSSSLQDLKINSPSQKHRNHKHLKKIKHDMATSMEEQKHFLGGPKVSRGGTMSASTSMTGLSRVQSFATFPKPVEDQPLPAVVEQQDESDGADRPDDVAPKQQDGETVVTDERHGNGINCQSGPFPVTVPPPTFTVTAPPESRKNSVTVVQVKINPTWGTASGQTDNGEVLMSTNGNGEQAVESTEGWMCCGWCRKSDKCCPNRKSRRRSGSHHRVKDPAEVQAVFSFLQILTAAFTAFAHGGNDVCNAIGPLIALWEVYSKGYIPTTSTTPFWILCFGGFGISVGLSVLGRKVIETVGTNLTPVIPSSGFCIGLGTATTVLVASKIGFPISTTHCIVGSVVAVGWLRSQSQVNWRLFSTILFGWFVTLPVTVGVSAAAMAMFSPFSNGTELGGSW